MLEDFTRCACIARNAYLLKTESLFTANKSAWFYALSEHFTSVCTQIQKMQAESILPAISYLEYTMLYTNFVNRRYAAEVWIYGDEYYLDKNQRMICDYDISFLFVYFDKLWDELLTLRKRYAGKVSSQDVKTFMLQILPDFYSYFANTARFAVAECIDSKPFINIVKDEFFMVNIGEYMAETETIFIENKNKDANELTKQFSEQHEKGYRFGDYSGLDFSRRFINYIDLSYSQFRYSNLSYSSLEGSLLMGINFRNTNMEKCCLKYCSIYESDFSNAILKNADFTGSNAKTGLINQNEWRQVGFLPVNFRNADLTGADFTGANLAGADFTGAILTDADFTNAILEGAIFDKIKI